MEDESYEIPNPQSDNDTSSDFLLALALQEEFDREEGAVRDKRTAMVGQRCGESQDCCLTDDEDYGGDGKGDWGRPRNSRGKCQGTRTSAVLSRLCEEGVLGSVCRCISRGKEAAVFHALSPEGAQIVLKIYSALTMCKNREVFLKFDPRIRGKINARKTAKFTALWALKEFFNLKKIREKGIRCPDPICVRRNVLVMSLVGVGESAPTLSSVRLSPRQLWAAYVEVGNMIEALFHRCHLVHADLSAFNLLYWGGHVHLVDVAQAVLTSHPNALQFLLGDIRKVLCFFGGKGLECAREEGAEEGMLKAVTHLTLEGLSGDIEDMVCALDRCRAENRKIF